MTGSSRIISDAPFRFLLGFVAGALLSCLLALIVGGAAGWSSFFVVPPVLGWLTVRFGKAFWGCVSRLIELWWSLGGL